MTRAPLTPVRFRDGAWECRCPMCGDWLELGLEFWQPRNGMTRCRACWRIYARLGARVDRLTAAQLEARRERNRANYVANRAKNIAASAAWRAKNPERIKASRRAYYLAHHAKETAAGQAYYQEARDVILFKKRDRGRAA